MHRPSCSLALLAFSSVSHYFSYRAGSCSFLTCAWHTDCKIAPPVPEIPLDDPSSPFGAGYGEGKWVAEHVLQNVTERRGVHTVVMRLGQVAGDRKGYWNEREWFPSLVKSALFQKCLPEHDGVSGIRISVVI